MRGRTRETAFTGTGSVALIDILANTMGSLIIFLVVFVVIAAQLTISTVELPHSLPNASCNTDYCVELAAKGGCKPYEWEIVDGALPAGLFLTKSGVIKGVPREEGEYHFMVRAIDANGNSGVRDLILKVEQEEKKMPLRIVTDALPDALTGTPYRVTLAATGGVGRYNWTVHGDLPPGLNLEEGKINGTPMSTGTWHFEIAVEDEHSTHKTQLLSLTVL